VRGIRTNLNMLRIFISSTFIDLNDFRSAVRDRVRQLGCIDVAMEHLGARDERPKNECLKLVREGSDGFVGIYAHRYGHVPDGEIMSITEAEYEEAGSAGIERLIYLLDEDVPWPKKYIDQGRTGKRLDALKRRLRANHICKTFANKDDLAASVVADVARTFPFKVLPRTDSTESGAYIPRSIREWDDSRNQLYRENRNVFLAHRLKSSDDPEQLYDIAIYLIPHRSNDPRHFRDDLSDVSEAEFFLGKYFANQVFRVKNRGGAIGIIASAYGPFMCTCCVTFDDGHKVLLSRYIDFEMGSVGLSPNLALQPEGSADEDCED